MVGPSPRLVSHSYWAYQVDNKRKIAGYWALSSVNGRAVAMAPMTLPCRSLTEKARLTYGLCPSFGVARVLAVTDVLVAPPIKFRLAVPFLVLRNPAT
jgi:hypothetical protein